ncbi:hypothetical protein EJB05_44958, partial [Eragrostis curvula]
MPYATWHAATAPSCSSSSARAVPMVVASSRDTANEVMKSHDAVFATRSQTTTIKILSKRGVGIALAPYGDHWQQLRKICNMELLSTKRVQSFRTIREEEAARLVSSISSASSSASLVNVSKMVAAYVTDAALRTIMGDRLKDRDDFIDQLAEGVRLAAGFSLSDLYPSSRLSAGALDGDPPGGNAEAASS